MAYINPNHMKPIYPDGYTIKEAELIVGRQPLESASRQFVNSIYKKALYFEDYDIVDLIEPWYDWHCKKYKLDQRANKRITRKTYKNKKKKYGDNYTERQLQIINGDIPYTELTGVDCMSIYKIAEKKNDTETMQIIDIIKADIKKARIERKNIGRIVNHEKNTSLTSSQEAKIFFTYVEQHVIGMYTFPECAKRDFLKNLLLKAYRFGDKDIIERVEFINALYAGNFDNPEERQYQRLE